MAQIFINDAVVQKQIEAWLVAIPQVVDGSVKLYMLGEMPDDEAQLVARVAAIGFEDDERQRADGNADSANLTVTFELAVADIAGDPVAETGEVPSTRKLAFIGQVLKEGLVGQAASVSGHLIELNRSSRVIGIGTQANELIAAQTGVFTVTGRVVCETVQSAAAIGDSIYGGT
jgi:hypothetical protein